MYTTFIFSFTELTTAIPHAGGPFAYSYRAFGPVGRLRRRLRHPDRVRVRAAGDRAGHRRVSQCAVSRLDPELAAVGAYVVFMALNIAGVTIAATFELVVTVLAIIELLVFMGVVVRRVSPGRISPTNGWAGAGNARRRALGGIFAAIPFAIWFFLAIEGAAMAAEEAKNPKRTIPRRLYRRHPDAGGAGVRRHDVCRRAWATGACSPTSTIRCRRR